MKRTLLLLSAFFAFSVYSNAQTVDQQYTSGTGATYANGPYSPTVGTGQSFTAGTSGQLSEIVVKVSGLSSTGTLDIRIFAGNVWSGTVLSTHSYTVSATGPCPMILSTPVNIVSGNQYTFVLSNPGGPAAGNFGFVDDFAGTYPGGNEWYLGVKDTTRDMWFKTYVGGVGIEHYDASADFSLSAYPNPFVGKLNIMTNASVKNIAIYNVLGENVENFEIKNGTAELDLENLENGIYFIQAQTTSGIVTRKVVKQN